MNALAVLCLQHGLERLLPHLPSLARPSIRLLETDAAGTAGSSFLGGLPDAPPHFVWPCLRDCQLTPQQAASLDPDAPLLFLGQLNWRQLKPYDLEDVLPSFGGALFFTGVGPGAGKYLVVPITEFAPRHFPLPPQLQHVLPRRLLQPWFEWSLPHYGLHGTIGGGDFQHCFFDTFAPEIEFLELGDTERKAYEQFKAELAHPGVHRHRVLGHPDYEQNPMQLDLERQAQKLELDYQTYLTLCDPLSPLTRQLKRQALASKWRLMFQVGHISNEESFVDSGGTHYFWSKQNDLHTAFPRFVGDGQGD